ncbi:MAG: aspartate kinase [Clostridia bacterium]|nr:aspartate kinase [Clostridia bacterium]
MIKTVKFGGSSLSDSSHFKQFKNIVLSDGQRKVVVVSAPGKRFKDDHKITDLLYLCGAHKQYGVGFDEIFGIIVSRYKEIADNCGIGFDLDSEFSELKRKISSGISADELASRGEYLSAKLAAAYLGYEFHDSADLIFFNYDGTLDKEKTYKAIQRAYTGRGMVIPGFYGSMPNGSIRTFTRGGSDITGALAAAALTADVYENWTDVSGILIADPKIVKNPPAISHITYNELRELSFIGAQVMHEDAVFPVRETNIPLNIRNTNDPSNPGTMIMEDFGKEESSPSFITGIAGKKGFCAVTVVKNGLSSTPGLLRKIIEPFEKRSVNICFIPAGIDSVSVFVSSAQAEGFLYDIISELQKGVLPNSIRVTEHIAVIGAVGRRMANKLGVSGKIFAELGKSGVNIRMITQGPDELNIIFGVEEKDFEQSIRVLYDSFVKEKQP